MINSGSGGVSGAKMSLGGRVGSGAGCGLGLNTSGRSNVGGVAGTGAGALVVDTGASDGAGTGTGAGDVVVMTYFSQNIYDKVDDTDSQQKMSAIEKYLWQKHSIMYPHILIFLAP
jgi:hypothetical protein